MLLVPRSYESPLNLVLELFLSESFVADDLLEFLDNDSVVAQFSLALVLLAAQLLTPLKHMQR